MRKITIIIFISLITHCCTRDNVDVEFHSIIKNAILKNEKCFPIQGMSFDWDSLLILQPYTIVNRLKIFDEPELKQIEKSGIQRRDDIYLIIFCLKGKIVKIFEAQMSKYDLSKLKYGVFYAKSINYNVSLETSNNIYILQSCENGDLFNMEN
jgi:hypothetical protein